VPMSAPTVASGTAPASLIVAPNDKYAYVGNFGADLQAPPAGPGTISQYSVGSDGSLTPMSSPTVVSDSGPNALTIDPASKYLYVANFGDNTVGQYTINSDGSLTAMPLPAVNSGGTPVGIAIDPTGSYVYVANRADGTISQYTVDPTAGFLTAMSTPFVHASTAVSGVTIDPTGQFLYATNRGDTTVSQFKIGTGGALVAMTAPTAAAGLHPTAIATGY
jgi:6-phosphogluconolactonase (cycloisomerase 2 family)